MTHTIQPHIEFLICTLDEGVHQIKALLMPVQPRISYLVSWQHSAEQFESRTNGSATTLARKYPLPEWLKERPDVRVVHLAGRGLSRNRNCALSHAQGDWLVIADDDCRYGEQSIAHIYEALNRHPDADILQLQVHCPDGSPLRTYPATPYEYRNRPRFVYISSCELVLRRQTALPRFDERFGLGVYLGCGEEELFVFQASKQGLKVYYEPLHLVVTDGQTTGGKFAVSKPVQRAKGGLLTLIHGTMGALLRCFKYAFVYRTEGWGRRCSYFFQMIKGIVYVHTHHTLP